MIKRLLIANRGEIAVRIAAACRELHITTIAVYADSDAGSLHCRAADTAVRLPGDLAADTYLNIDAVLEAARRSDADAIHPGYGFLSENAVFAARCAEANITFIGPAAAAIERMGSKIAARALVESQQLPVVPGYHGADQSPQHLLQVADTIGYPLLIKASAGGGGVGMRLVEHRDAFAAALTAARNEARRAFNDDSVLLERYFERVRHIEIQVLADGQGNIIHLFERECSIQRRQQKVIEEAPAPGLGAVLRRRLGEAVVAIARAVDYTGAGTVEFLLVDNGLPEADAEFYFLEMNTRLQVEHAVTEAITGIDIVQWQIRIAEGRALTLAQADLTIRGHAIECRWYAEDPDRRFSPQTGTIDYWQPAGGAGLRIDGGIHSGQTVSSFYDPLLARLISWAEDRTQALRALSYHLERCVLLGLTTNQHYLRSVLQLPAFGAARTHTRFLQQHAEHLSNRPRGAVAQCALIAAAVGYCEHHRDLSEPRTRNPVLPAGTGATTVRFHWLDREVVVQVEPRPVANRTPVFDACLGDRHFAVDIVGVEVLPAGVVRFDLSIDGVRAVYTLRVARDAIALHSIATGSLYLPLASRFTLASTRHQHGGYRAPMPGRVVEVLVSAGQQVERGAPLVVMESMKMESTTRAQTRSRVEKVWVAAGDTVEADTLLVALEEIEVMP
ncbi:ATP-grasp domain-containing protein [Exilibacterium tricleocarpae]|uniref:Biotin carboxylase n=1 Tax=Exilibacterium tricleocarpae TaxID=2591008 RepID=A0A545TLL7_9GAMM|nr:biotin carboxylase N-terminal domain-containing protein [Exilibacterium tricleocarpae]TQV78119.1 ATP-grasp domain-containing protein [Exilibacterium tricleocarpae]